MFPPEILALIAMTFLIAGTVKGLVGLGLPTVVLALLSSGIGLREAIALTLVPALVMNIWQAFAGGELVHILRRFWAWLIAICVGIWFGTSVLAGADVSVLTGLLGVLLVIYSVFSLATPQLPAPGQRERWLSPIFGGVAGVVAGMTGALMVPGVLYIQALGMRRDLMVQCLGVTFLLSTITVLIAFRQFGMLPASLGATSALALVPAVIGMAIGQRLRKRLPEERFRPVFFAALLGLGLVILVRSLL